MSEFLDKNSDEIYEEVKGIAEEETGLKNPSPVGVFTGILRVISRIIDVLTGNIRAIGANATYLTTEDEFFMDMYAAAELVPEGRLQPLKAAGSFLATADRDGRVRAGTWIKTGAGLRYKVVSDVDFAATPNGSFFEIYAEAEFTGAQYNIQPGIEVFFSRVVVGITSLAVSVDNPPVGGRDIETLDEVRERIKAFKGLLGSDSRPAKYAFLALTVPQVNDAAVIRIPRGPGSVDVLVSTPSGLPDAQVIADVEAVIADARLLARDIEVRAPVAALQDFTVEYSGAADPGEVSAALLLFVQGFKIGESLLLRRLYTEIFTDLNVDTFLFTQPLSDRLVNENEKIIAGNISAIKQG